MVYPFTIPLPLLPAPTAVPLPPTAFLTPDQAMSASPPVPMPVPTPIYTAPPLMIFSASTTFAPAHITESFPFPTPQPNINLRYQASPPLNIPFLKPGMLIQTALTTPLANFLPEEETEQERRLKRMEETIRALQGNETRPNASYDDCGLFLGMRLPLKVKIPEFKTYEGTTDPRHHLRHYRGKMLQYWDYEEFVIHSFQDSLTGSALDWFMSLKAEDIPAWANLSRKFIDQYQYCAEAPSILIELSMREMAQGQKFENYAAKWRAQAAKHIPPISEVQQIQLFHYTLRGVYYSHLLASTSSFFDFIEAGKKLDMGIKLSMMEGPVGKGEGEPSRRATAGAPYTEGRKGKEMAVNVINPGHPGAQPYSVNFTPPPPSAPGYVPPTGHYQPHYPAQPIYYSAPPVPLLLAASQPIFHYYTLAPPQTSQYRPSALRAPQLTQQVTPPQGQ
ncbi:uncharacterized protein LOC116209128 [Punica granatum]|uniref:Uncharacterized protein LOC116209128 n=1 Tax=Punica granatum TaxID=22663 RepID=A0A6P8DVZ2_PUNGR|nr:uncharacterized protein LOC116209128 [Punica granatum]